jgi:WhiB family transcriptional regulator, redox-sensing transcriptional regulator
MKKSEYDPLVRRDWRAVAACRDEDPELFFPIGTSGPAVAQAEQARTVCQRCPAIGYCVLYALAAGEDNGVWGGMTDDERRVAHRSPGFNNLAFAETIQIAFNDRHPELAVLPLISDTTEAETPVELEPLATTT